MSLLKLPLSDVLASFRPPSPIRHLMPLRSGSENPGTTSERSHPDGSSPPGERVRVGDTKGLGRKTAIVDGRPVAYGVIGEGPAVLFLHGWGLRPWSYEPSLRAIAATGVRVVAPCLPGFGHTRELPEDERTFPGLGAWVARFVDAVGVDKVDLTIGHSFGGGVAVSFAAVAPERSGGVMLLNAVGGPTWNHVAGDLRMMAQRPWWDWSREGLRDLVESPRALLALPRMAEDFLPNLFDNPLGMLRTGGVIRRANLLGEVAELAGRLPVTVVWSDRDSLIPRATFDDLRHAANTEGVVVEGGHSWLLNEPEVLAELVVSALIDSRLADQRKEQACPANSPGPSSEWKAPA